MSEVLVLITLNFPEPLVERLRALSPRLTVRVHPARSAQDLPEDLLALRQFFSFPPRQFQDFHLSVSSSVFLPFRMHE
jgi:hypothetical protein